MRAWPGSGASPPARAGKNLGCRPTRLHHPRRRTAAARPHRHPAAPSCRRLPAAAPPGSRAARPRLAEPDPNAWAKRNPGPGPGWNRLPGANRHGPGGAPPRATTARRRPGPGRRPAQDDVRASRYCPGECARPAWCRSSGTPRRRIPRYPAGTAIRVPRTRPGPRCPRSSTAGSGAGRCPTRRLSRRPRPGHPRPENPAPATVRASAPGHTSRRRLPRTRGRMDQADWRRGPGGSRTTSASYPMPR